MANFFDVVFVADPRFSGGTSTALASEIVAARRAGLSAALIPIMGPILRSSWPYHPLIAKLIREKQVAIIDRGQPVRATFGLLHHPGVFAGIPVEPLGLLADRLVLILHHPLRDGEDKPEYDLPAILTNILTAFGKMPLLAPVGPLVRRQLSQGAPSTAEVLPEDWSNLIDPEEWPARSDRRVERPIRIGRHSRPLPQKFPANRELAISAYPDRADIEVTMLGADPVKLRRVYGDLPAHWNLIPFGTIEPRDYLRDLDFYVYFHAPEWVEAFGRAILEAAATGLVVVLPEHFRPVFGPAAIYCSEDEVLGLIDELTSDPRRYRYQAARARRHVQDSFGLERFAERLRKLGSDWSELAPARPKRDAFVAHQTRQTALFVTSNGVGLGHLTRTLAVADKMPPEIEPVFFTLSQAAGLVRNAGYTVEFRPFHRVAGCDIDSWNRALQVELVDAIAFYAPSVLVFDGNVPYQGLCDALETSPETISIWMRRGFWRDRHANALRRASCFDAVIEPGDLADALDTGPTAAHRGAVHRVAPIIRGDPATRLERRAARRVLRLPEDATLGLVSLGAQTNFDLSKVSDALNDWSAQRPEIRLVHLKPWIGRQPESCPNDLDLELYPVFPVSRAFDFQISTCGYNSFHEAILGETPTVFVPNEAAEMDLQAERARYGALAGASLTLRKSKVLGAANTFERIADPAVRDLMREAARRLSCGTGAAEAAGFICDYARLRRVRALTSPSK